MFTKCSNKYPDQAKKDFVHVEGKHIRILFMPYILYIVILTPINNTEALI